MYDACGLLVKRGELADHLKVDCICRPEKCRICNESVNRNMMKVLYICENMGKYAYLLTVSH